MRRREEGEVVELHRAMDRGDRGKQGVRQRDILICTRRKNDKMERHKERTRGGQGGRLMWKVFIVNI